MSKYSHFEMCEKIFGQKYKWNEQKHDYEPYSRTDMWNKMIEQQDKISDLEAKLAESEKSKESYRLQNEHHHLQLLQFYSRLGVEAFGADIHEKALETLMIMKEQLAEKEKKIEKLNACVDFYKSYSVSFQEKVIDELERVKEFCNNPKNRVEYEYCPNAWAYAVDKDKLMLEIDNQIKQLKES